MNTKMGKKSLLHASLYILIIIVQIFASIAYYGIKLFTPLLKLLGITISNNSKLFFISFNDLVFLHRNKYQKNVKKLLISGISLLMIIQVIGMITTNSVHAVNNIVDNSNPTLTKQEKVTINKHVNALSKKTVAMGKATTVAPTQNVLPNGDYMPNGINYVTVNALSDSPAMGGSNFKIVDKLFTNPVNQDEIFLNKIAPGAQIAAKSYGVNPSVLIAQAALESGWGQSDLALKDNNYFGIKGSYNGQSVRYLTTEETASGQSYQIYDNFAKFPDIATAMAGNAKLLRYGPGASMPNNYYAGAWSENTKSYADATSALTRTYATDVTYKDKLNKIIEHYGLYVLDDHYVHNTDLVQKK